VTADRTQTSAAASKTKWGGTSKRTEEELTDEQTPLRRTTHDGNPERELSDTIWPDDRHMPDDRNDPSIQSDSRFAKLMGLPRTAMDGRWRSMPQIQLFDGSERGLNFAWRLLSQKAR
jgi:hypothetical protein